MNEKINLQELSILLSEKAGITKKEAEIFLREFFGLLTESLITDKQVKIKDLGTFKLTHVEDRESVNVRTGQRVLIPAHQKISFSPASLLSEMVNKPFALFEPIEIAEINDPDQENTSKIENTDVPIPELNNENDQEPKDTKVENESAEEDLSMTNIQSAEANKPEEIETVENVISESPIIEPIIEPENIKVDPEEIKANQNDSDNEINNENHQHINNKDITEEFEEEDIEEEDIEEEEEEIDNEEDINNYPETFDTPRKPVNIRKILSVIFIIAIIFGIGTLVYLWFTNYHFKSTVDNFTESVISLFSESKEESSSAYKPGGNVNDTMTENNISIQEDSIKKDSIKAPSSEPTNNDTIKEVFLGQPTKTEEEKKPEKKPEKKREKAEEIKVKERILKSGERLTVIALQEYGHKAFWVYIYEENRNLISNPNLVPAGTKLKIPPAKKYGIDKNNPASIDKAKKLAKKYL